MHSLLSLVFPESSIPSTVSRYNITLCCSRTIQSLRDLRFPRMALSLQVGSNSGVFFRSPSTCVRKSYFSHFHSLGILTGRRSHLSEPWHLVHSSIQEINNSSKLAQAVDCFLVLILRTLELAFMELTKHESLDSLGPIFRLLTGDC